MPVTTRTECAGCGGGLRTVLDLGTSPLADRFPLPDDPSTSAWYPLRMAACTDCGLAQLLDVVDDSELFGEDYGFRTAGSPSLVRYYSDWASWAMEHFAPRFVVDIGCNDGTLLQFFQQAGCGVLGVDPSEAAGECRDKGIPLEQWPFGISKDDGLTLRGLHGAADLVTGINVAAHVAEPLLFLRSVADLLTPDGRAVLEFHDVEALVAGCQFDQVYHEHRFFYGARTFGELARKAGLEMATAFPTPGQGGSLRVVLRHKSAAYPPYGEGLFMGLSRMSHLMGLQERAEFVKLRLLREIFQAQDRGVVAGYGATAKSCTLLNFCDISSQELAYVEDATPSKVGRLTPGSHIPIVAPGQHPPPETYLLLAWNYLGDVLRRERAYADRGGKFIVPIPVPMTI